ncbi:MAG: 50S ribosomal protein L15 [Candidatus Electryonea clarkiae]|nr:50S ribosomal protein L15 [Candidatus Electryonea clarkiae]MDP8288608.1 50S ribosomal protein L15 [Candidatus Electryonea clarkiae]
MPKDLSNLKPAKGSVRKNRRRGRGPGSGLGGTSGKGHKGQQSRSGYKRRRWFEGGQMPIQRRLPKRGFKNIWREEVQIINIRDLARIGDDVKIVNSEVLEKNGLIANAARPVKLLGEGDVSRAIEIDISAVSSGAKEKIEAAGGKVTVPGPTPKRRKYIKKSLRQN